MKLNKDTAYLLGSLRDGSLAKSSIYETTVASDYHKGWITQVVVPRAARAFGIPHGRIRVYEIWTHKSQRPFYRAKIYSVRVRKEYSRFYEPGNQVFWETPEAVRDSDFDTRKEYIRGFFDAEGGCRDVDRYLNGITKTMNCEISIRCKHSKSPNEPLVFMREFLEDLDVRTHLRRDETAIVITGKRNVLRFYRKIGPLHPRKSRNMRTLLRYYKAFDPAEA